VKLFTELTIRSVFAADALAVKIETSPENKARRGFTPMIERYFAASYVAI